MKTILLFFFVATFSFPVVAQSDLFSELTGEYMDENGFSASQITKDMFDLYLKKKNIEKNSPVYEALNSLNKIVVVSLSDFASGADAGTKQNDGYTTPKAIHETILEHYKSNDYTLFKTEKRMGEDVKVFLEKEDDMIRTLALVTNSESLTSLIELQGDIDLATVSELSKAFNLRGLENLYKINNTDYFVAPDVTGGVSVHSLRKTEEMAERQREMAEHQHNISKEQEREMELQAQLMAEKHREMAEKYQRQPIFLTEPGDTNAVFYIDGKKVKSEDIKELDHNNISRIEVNKSDKENGKSTIRITTK